MGDTGRKDSDRRAGDTWLTLIGGLLEGEGRMGGWILALLSFAVLVYLGYVLVRPDRF